MAARDGLEQNFLSQASLQIFVTCLLASAITGKEKEKTSGVDLVHNLHGARFGILENLEGLAVFGKYIGGVSGVGFFAHTQWMGGYSIAASALPAVGIAALGIASEMWARYSFLPSKKAEITATFDKYVTARPAVFNEEEQESIRGILAGDVAHPKALFELYGGVLGIIKELAGEDEQLNRALARAIWVTNQLKASFDRDVDMGGLRGGLGLLTQSVNELKARLAPETAPPSGMERPFEAAASVSRVRRRVSGREPDSR